MILTANQFQSSIPILIYKLEMSAMYIYRMFSSGLRFCHWILAACIVVLFLTGLYIGNPSFIGTQGNEPTSAVTKLFSMETIRFIHFSTAAIFGTTLLLRFYLFFTYRGNRLFPNPRNRSYWQGLQEMLAYYTLAKPHHRTYLRNPLAATFYVCLYILMVLELATGLAMYAMIDPNSWLAHLFMPINGWLGNEFMTHTMHHIIAWGFFISFLTHIYLVFYNDVMEKSGELSSIVSGQKHFPEQPVDALAVLVVRKENEQ
jgi:Ni/Fe-hydrogenase 1 B-type cytochrome subunit